MDAPPIVAAALKDVLTEKGFREGSIFKESKVASVIIIGNKSPEDLSTNNSLKAFYNERFPFQLEMIWKNFSAKSYTKFLEIYFKEKFHKYYNEFLLLAELCANTKTLVSPRIAASAGEVLLNLGPKFLTTVSGIDTTDIDLYEKKIKTASILYKEEKILSKLNEIFNSLVTNEKIKDSYEIKMIHCQMILKYLINYEFSNDNVIKAGCLKTMVEKFIETETNAILKNHYNIQYEYNNLII